MTLLDFTDIDINIEKKMDNDIDYYRYGFIYGIFTRKINCGSGGRFSLWNDLLMIIEVDK